MIARSINKYNEWERRMEEVYLLSRRRCSKLQLLSWKQSSVRVGDAGFMHLWERQVTFSPVGEARSLWMRLRGARDYSPANGTGKFFPLDGGEAAADGQSGRRPLVLEQLVCSRNRKFGEHAERSLGTIFPS